MRPVPDFEGRGDPHLSKRQMYLDELRRILPASPACPTVCPTNLAGKSSNTESTENR